MRRAMPLLLALVLAMLTVASAAQAKPGNGGGGGKDDGYPPPAGVIYAGAGGAGLYEISPDGSGGIPIGCPSGFPDLSHGAIGSDRWFIFAQAIEGEVDPEGFERDELFVFRHSDRYDPSCIQQQVSDFANVFPFVHPMIPRWSPDGTKVAFVAWSSEEDAPDAVVGTYDVWVADVAETDGTIQLANIRDLSVDVTTGTIWPLSWSADSQWITYSHRDSSGSVYRVYVVDVTTGEEFDVTPDTSRHEFQPAFAPDTNGTSYRIAFMRAEDAVTPTNYVWVGTLTIDAATGAPTGPLGDVTQLTAKKSGNITAVAYPAWEPDGNYLVFSGTGSSLSGRYDVYRMRADGKGKAVSITDFLFEGSGRASIWRTGP